MMTTNPKVSLVRGKTVVSLAGYLESSVATALEAKAAGKGNTHRSIRTVAMITEVVNVNIWDTWVLHIDGDKIHRVEFWVGDAI